MEEEAQYSNREYEDSKEGACELGTGHIADIQERILVALSGHQIRYFEKNSHFIRTSGHRIRYLL
ncbi:hypothetical protein MHI43_24170 [Paenibacillus sp. FSL H8-0457]|uniref:hypothetical protein n=1 Tax=Paenibacillus sp. FSL H8-0457 TaxID=2921386 RepID=UPI0003E202B0|nr:hypothetical protein C172_04193 [Paenibacillus sp. FSL H8-457]